jgi:hypothetical protein
MSSAVAPGPDRKRARLVGLVLAGLAVGLAAGGAALYSRTSQRLREDPGLAYRTPESLDKMLARGEDAERAGHRDAAIDAYRFIVKVGAAGNPELMRYVAAARRNLERLGAEPQP